MMEICPICDGSVQEKHLLTWDRPTEPPVTIHDVDVLACLECGEQFLTPEQGKEVDRKTNAALRAAKGLLSAEEVKTLTKTISKLSGMPETKVAEGLGISRMELHRWRNNDRLQSQLADTFLRYISNDPAAFAEFLATPTSTNPKRDLSKKHAS
jgi:DNA-binding transcriptional regulator YiaG